MTIEVRTGEMTCSDKGHMLLASNGVHSGMENRMYSVQCMCTCVHVCVLCVCARVCSVLCVCLNTNIHACHATRVPE